MRTEMTPTRNDANHSAFQLLTIALIGLLTLAGMVDLFTSGMA